MIRARVLVVEDDESMQEFYEHFFTAAHKNEFTWHLAQSGRKALEYLARNPIDVVILDWRLSDASGLDILNRIRSNPSTKRILVFMVSANSRREDIVTGLKAGADDYLPKPVFQEELLERLRSLMRRGQTAFDTDDIYKIGDLRLNVATDTVFIADQEVQLKPKQMDLLNIFLRRPNVIHAPRDLWDTIWCYPSKHWRRTLTITLSALRSRLGHKWGGRIEARYEKGYLFRLPAGVSTF